MLSRSAGGANKGYGIIVPPREPRAAATRPSWQAGLDMGYGGKSDGRASGPGAGWGPGAGRVIRRHDGCEEVGEVCREGVEGFGTLGQAAFSAEGDPLFLFVGEVRRGGGEDRGKRRQFGAAMAEGCGDGLAQFVAGEGEGAGEDPDVVKVFHAAVEESELDHGFNFFGDEGFAVVGAEGRGGEIEEGRELDVFGAGGDDVVEADVDLDAEPDGVEAGLKGGTNAFVVGVFFDKEGGDGLGVKEEPVGDGWLKGADFLKEVADVFGGVGGASEEVDVHGGPGGFAVPHEQHLCAFEDEAVGVGGLGKTGEETFDGVALGEFLKGQFFFAGAVEEPLADGSGEVGFGGIHRVLWR